jgi:hypothetical protein
VRLVEATLGRKAKIQIQKSLERGKPIVKLMAKKIADLDKALTNMAINKDRVEKDIHEKAEKLIDVIRKQEASLCSEVEEFYGRKQEIIKPQTSNLYKLHSDTLNRVQDAEAILKQGWSDATKISDIATALVQQLKEVTELNLEESVDMSTFDENLELCMNAEATCNSILQGETFGKVTRKFLNTNSISSNVSHDDDEVLEYEFNLHSLISLPAPLDESEGDRYKKSNKLAAESDDSSRVNSGNVKQKFLQLLKVMAMDQVLLRLELCT